MRRHIYFNLSKSAKIITLLVILTLLASSFITYKLVRDSSKRSQGSSIALAEGSVVLGFSGRIIESPEGYEFVTESENSTGNYTEYIFTETDAESSIVPRVTEYDSTIDEQVETYNAVDGINRKLENNDQYIEYVTDEPQGRIDVSDFKSETKEEGDVTRIDMEYKIQLATDQFLNTYHTVLLDFSSGVRTDIEIGTNEGNGPELVNMFAEVL